jgi:hypothetical protein
MCFEMFGSSLQKASASSWFAKPAMLVERGDDDHFMPMHLALGWESGTLGAQLLAAVVILCGKKRLSVSG